MKVKPGLGNFATAELAAASLVPLLEFAKKEIPDDLHEETPIYLWATAGLRSLEDSHSGPILAACRSLLANFPFRHTAEEVKIISGVDEGIYGWIATNYLLKRLDHSEASNAVSSAPSVVHTLGVLELGGASFQLTFSPSQPEVFHSSQLWRLDIAGRSYNIFTASYLNYGLERAQDLHWEILLQTPEPDAIENDPCRPRGLNRKHPSEDAHIHGDGDYERCQRHVDEIIQGNSSDEGERIIQRPLEQSAIAYRMGNPEEFQACSPSNDSPPCAFNNSPIPRISPAFDHFLAIENFYYTAEFFSLLESPNIPKFLKENGKSFCSGEWQEILEQFPKEPRDDLEKYCFSSVYLVRVLELALGMGKCSEESVDENDRGVCPNGVSPYSHIQFTKFLNGVQLDWALGAVLKLLTDSIHKDLYGIEAETLFQQQQQRKEL